MKNGKKRKKHREDLHTRHLRRVQAVMKALGLLKEYQQLKPVERDRVLKFQASGLKVVLANDVDEDQRARHLACELEDALNATMVEIGSTERFIPLKDYFRVVEPLAALFRHPQTRATGRLRLDALAQAFYAAIHLSEETFENALTLLVDTMQSVLLNNSRIDERLYWLQMPQATPYVPERWKFQLRYEGAQIYREHRGSGSQLLYRSGIGSVGELQWLSWSGSQLGMTGDRETYPVYLSSHALQQFRQRIPGSIFGPHLEHFIFESLLEPVFSAGERDTRLVAFRLPPGKLGYFVVDVVQQRVILRTFLFLTMNNTPEGDMLFQKLKLARSDKEHLELDQLSTFMLSDIKQDPQLRQVFDECGCGHLLTIVPEQIVHPAMTDRGNELRKYLGRQLERLLTDVDAQKYRT